jgi:hypothetical protein
MKKSIITALLALVAIAATAAVPDSLKKDLEDYDYLVSFVEKNYAPFDAIMQKGYKREYKALKKQIREQLSKGNSSLGKATSDYVMWFYSQFDRHLELETREFQMAEGNMMSWAIIKLDSTILTNPEFEYNPKPVSCKVDSLTWLIRVPSCSPGYHEWTTNALQQFDESDCENLIIDVRGNGGGSDGVWNNFYDILYDRPNKPYTSWFRNTPENINQWKIYAMKWQQGDERIRNFVEKCEKSKKKFMKWGEETSDAGCKPTARIRRAAILVDMTTASAAESIAEFAKRHSNRAQVYGIGNTMGCELTGNCREGVLPNSKIKITYATTVDSGFYEKDFSEGLGIVPDVIIPLPMARKFTDNIDEWVLWVAEDLKR